MAIVISLGKNWEWSKLINPSIQTFSSVLTKGNMEECNEIACLARRSKRFCIVEQLDLRAREIALKLSEETCLFRISS